SVYRLSYHVVWVCKYRRRVLKPGICNYLIRVLSKLQRRLPGVIVEAIGFDLDHLHMVIKIPPRFSISSVVGMLKSQSVSLIRREFPVLKDVYWKENVFWSPGYFVSSVGVNEKIIRNYVEYQGLQDLGQLQMEL
ncbi:IS200/IS605 family transposase, partial [Candidatus Babeliales bacterium]|nr:IS200/IS605 family transposase [Candidatus Babeliales bacterium]